LVCLSAGRAWGEGGDQYRALAAETLEALRVFWTWIGDHDHGEHPTNLIYEVVGGVCSVVAIDHSYSLCSGNLHDPLAIAASGGYGTINMPEVARVRDVTVDAIQAADQGAFVEIVRRLSELLTSDEQDRIIRIVSERTNHLRALLSI
jgi:hypothetical protein